MRVYGFTPRNAKCIGKLKIVTFWLKGYTTVTMIRVLWSYKSYHRVELWFSELCVLLFKYDWWDVGNNKTRICIDANFTSIDVN